MSSLTDQVNLIWRVWDELLLVSGINVSTVSIFPSPNRYSPSEPDTLVDKSSSHRVSDHITCLAPSKIIAANSEFWKNIVYTPRSTLVYTVIGLHAAWFIGIARELVKLGQNFVKWGQTGLKNGTIFFGRFVLGLFLTVHPSIGPFLPLLEKGVYSLWHLIVCLSRQWNSGLLVSLSWTDTLSLIHLPIRNLSSWSVWNLQLKHISIMTSFILNLNDFFCVYV